MNMFETRHKPHQQRLAYMKGMDTVQKASLHKIQMPASKRKMLYLCLTGEEMRAKINFQNWQNCNQWHAAISGL